MRQIWIPKPGPPNILEVRSAPDPTPSAGQVRVRTEAIGINFAELMARMGLYEDAPKMPCVVGYEASGTVDAVGDGVTDYAIGDRVIVLTQFGGYSDVICQKTELVVPLPDELSFQQGAALPVQYLTAWIMLKRLANVQPGQSVLVHSAGGGVGLAALQICRDAGATVYGTASPGKHKRLLEMGLDHAIDYRNDDFEEVVMRLTHARGVDVVIDAVGGESFKKSYRCLSTLGRLYCFGGSAFTGSRGVRSVPHLIRTLMKMPKYKPFDLMSDNRGVMGINLGHMWHLEAELRAMLVAIVEQARVGVLRPVIDATFPLERCAEAHAYIQDRKNFGKVLLTTA